MSYENFPIYGSAGNASDATMCAVGATSTMIIGNLTAYNTSAGSLTLTIKVKENDGTLSTLVFDTVGATSSVSYSGGSTKRITPITLAAGNQLLANGSGAGIKVRASALRFY